MADDMTIQPHEAVDVENATKPQFTIYRARDAKALAELDKLGWRTLVVFECALKDPASLRARLAAALDGSALA